MSKNAHVDGFFDFIYFKVLGREPAVTHRIVCAASSPGSTDLYDVQPNPADLSFAQKKPNVPLV